MDNDCYAHAALLLLFYFGIFFLVGAKFLSRKERKRSHSGQHFPDIQTAARKQTKCGHSSQSSGEKLSM